MVLRRRSSGATRTKNKKNGGQRNGLRVREKTRREADVRAHPGPRVWVAWPLRGNQEAPSQPGGHARCSSRNTAFVRASWVGPPNRASPMRGFGVAVETCGAVRERVGRRTNQGSAHAGVRSGVAERARRRTRCRSLPPKQGLAHARVCDRSRNVWSGASACGSSRPNRASPGRAFAIVFGACGEARILPGRPRTRLAGRSPCAGGWLAVCAATPQMRPSLVA
jgi:hypothetical protein